MNAVMEGTELVTTQQPMSELISAAEINQQIATAKRYPRSITEFMREARAMVTLNESIAQQCIYALPRDGKTIEGPSARFAEIVAHAWGNSRAGARIVNEGQEFITAQGVMHDLEKNVAITFEVQRRITDKNGKRYKADMIGVTGNAASSIALRNAILKAVPKAFWEPLYGEARKVVAGDVKTLANKRAEAIKQFAIFGVNEAQILAKLGKAGIADVTVDDLLILFGILTAIKEGDTTPEEAFADDPPPSKSPQRKSSRREASEAAPNPPSVKAEAPASGDSPSTKLADADEKEFCRMKLEALQIPLAEACAEKGISNFEKLTTDGYLALRELIRENEQ